MKYVFHSKSEYYDILVAAAHQARKGDRLAVASMGLWSEESAVARLMKTLTQAASRGTEVIVMVDAYNFMIRHSTSPGPLLFKSKLPAATALKPPYRVRLESLEQLAAAGGAFSIVNRPHRAFTNPFAGRSHIKCAILNDQVFIGGCNLTYVDDIDMMVSCNDAKLADGLFRFIKASAEHGQVKEYLYGTDQIEKIDSTTSLLIDAGTKGKSVIFDHALRLIDEASAFITITCPYFPNDDTTARLAAAAARGVEVKIIYNHADKQKVPLSLLHRAVDWKQRRLHPANLFANVLPPDCNYLHAKLLVTDQGSIMGSHNLVKAGVNFGTAEMALLSKDPLFGVAALNALRRQLPSSIRI